MVAWVKPTHRIARVIGLLGLLAAGCSRGGEAIVPTPLPPLEVVAPAEYTVTLGTVRRTLAFTGRVTPVVSQPIFFEVEGVVTGVLFQPGDAVAAGDLIAHLSTGDLEHDRVNAELALQIAGLQTNQADLVAAEIALSRAVTDDEQRLAEAQLADAGNQAAARQLALQALRADIARIEAEITRRRVAAPFDGVLQTVSVRPGDRIAAFAPVAVVVDPSQLEVTAQLSPADLSLLGVGQAVTVTLPARQVSHPGAIRQLPVALGAAGDNVARIRLPETAELTPGELANVDVVLEERRDVLTLPPAAIRTFQGRTFVIVAEPDGTRRRYDVRLGLQSDALVEIVAGLEAGQVVVGE
jgi:RND family efflux transporter MFP subunit